MYKKLMTCNALSMCYLKLQKKKVSKLHTVVMLLSGECHFESNHLGMGENVPLTNFFLLKHCWNLYILRWELYFHLLLLCLCLDASKSGLQTQCQQNVTKWLTDKDHFWSTEISDWLKRRGRWTDSFCSLWSLGLSQRQVWYLPTHNLSHCSDVPEKNGLQHLQEWSIIHNLKAAGTAGRLKMSLLSLSKQD